MSEKITFSELVEHIAEQSKQSQASTSSFIGELVNIIESGLRNSGSVSISGFGKFELRWMNERPGVNPQTGEQITIPGQNKVVFKPYKALREDVNRPYSKMEPQVLDESPGDSSDKKNEDEVDESAQAATPAPPAKTSPEKEDQDDGNDFLIERPSPAKGKLDDVSDEEKELNGSPNQNITEEKKVKQENYTPVPVHTGGKEDSNGSDSPNGVEPKLPADQKIPAINAGDKSKLTKQAQDSGTFNWTYAAAAIIVALAIFILFLLSRQYMGDDTPRLASEQEQITAPVTPSPDVNETEVNESEPPPAEPDSPPKPETEIHTVDAGETLWSISENDLGNPYLWPMIYGLNLDQIDNPNIITVSANLTVPVISDPDNLSESQLEQVAEGYLAVYQWTRTNNPEEAKYFLWAVGVFSPEMLDLAASSVDQADLTFAKTR